MKWMRAIGWGLLLSLTIVWSGCRKPADPVEIAPAKADPLDSIILGRAQPKLNTIKLYVGPEILTTEVAVRPVELANGMMFRQDMGENEAMLFLLGQPSRASFYMKNTVVPLSIAYLGEDGTILEIHDLQPLNEEPVYSQSDKVFFALEVKQGWFKRHNIVPGTVVRTEAGSLYESFYRRGQGGRGAP